MESDYSEEVPVAHVYVVDGLVDAGGVLKMQTQMLLKLGGRSIRILHVPLSQRVLSKTIAGTERLVFIVISLYTVLHPRQDHLNSRLVSRTSSGRFTTKYMASMFFPVTGRFNLNADIR